MFPDSVPALPKTSASETGREEEKLKRQVLAEVRNLHARYPEMGWDMMTQPEALNRNLLTLAAMSDVMGDCRHCRGLGFCRRLYNSVRWAEIEQHDDIHHGVPFVHLYWGPCHVARQNQHLDSKKGYRVWNDGVMH